MPIEQVGGWVPERVWIVLGRENLLRLAEFKPLTFHSLVPIIRFFTSIPYVRLSAYISSSATERIVVEICTGGFLDESV